MMKSDFMDKLLDGVEVEYKTLGEITNVLRGRRLTRDKLSDAERFPVFHGGLEPLGHYGISNRPAYSVMIINVGASAGTVGYSDVEFWSSDGCYCIQHSDLLDNKFLYYFLIGQQHLLRSKVRFAGIPTLNAIVIEKLEIPIPCPENPKKSLEIQAEIVRVLDTFAELTVELTAELTVELTARKKQYTYYRDQLLTFEEGEIVWKKIKDVVKIKNGKDWKKLGVGDIPVYGSGGIMKYVDESAYDKPTVLIPRKGSITNIFYVETPFWNVDTIYYTEIDINQLIPKFFYHYMKTIDLLKLDTGSARPSLTQTILNEIPVPIPTLTEQKLIVSILDKFDALISSITEGLPREIELRQKQYEYYRNMLLSFPKEEVKV